MSLWFEEVAVAQDRPRRTTTTMTTATKRSARPDYSPFVNVDVGEPITALVGTYGHGDAVAELLRALSAASVAAGHPGTVSVVLHLPSADRSDCVDVRKLITSLAAISHRLTIVPDAGVQHLSTPALLAHTADLDRPVRSNVVLVEPDAAHAVVGSMLWLRPGDTIALVWPTHASGGESGACVAHSLLARAVAWRSTFVSVDDVGVHARPQP